jgi:hypothetical protein
MARPNTSPIGGFRYWGSFMGEVIEPLVLPKQIATAYATALGVGDPVKQLADGSVAQAAAASDAIFGICAGFRYLNAAGVMVESNYYPASTAYTADAQRTIAMVIPATPYTIFECDANDGVTITTLASARTIPWENVDHIFTTAVNQFTGRSGVQLNISGRGTAAKQWRIVDVSPTAPNDVTQTNAKYTVVCNNTQNWPGVFSTTGI